MVEKNIIVSVEKSIKVLNALAKEPYSLTANEISKEVDLNRSTVHRLLTTLLSSRMVIQDKNSSKYMIGPQAYRIGMAYQHHFDSNDTIRSCINDVARELNMNVGYSIKDGMSIISFYETELYSDVIFGYKIGSKWPITRGACARSILAFHEPFEEIEELINNATLVKKTPYTITDYEQLIQKYRETRQQGYAFSDQENILGALGIGYPVRDIYGEVVATITVAAIKASLTDEKINYILKSLEETAKKIQAFLV